MIKNIEKVVLFEAAVKQASPGMTVSVSSFKERGYGDTIYDMTETNGWVYFVSWDGVYKAHPDGTELSKIADGKCCMIRAHEDGSVTFFKNVETYSEFDESARQFDRYSVDVRCTVMPNGKIIESEPSKGYMGSSN